MKITFNLLITISMLFAGNLSVEAQGVCKITGKVKGALPAQLIFSHKDQYQIFQKYDTITVNTNGIFSYKWNLNQQSKTAYLKLSNKDSIALYGLANKTIIIDIDAGRAKFRGPMARIQQYLTTIPEKEKELLAHYKKRNPKFAYATYPSDLITLDSMTNDHIAHLNQSFEKKTDIEKSFINYQRNSFVFRNLYFKMMCDFHPSKYQFLKPASDTSKFTYQFTDEINFDRPELISNEEFIKFSAFCFQNIMSNQQEVELSPSTLIPFISHIVDNYAKSPTNRTVLKTALVNEMLEELKDFNDKSAKAKMYEDVSEFIQELYQTKTFQNTAQNLKRNLQASLTFLAELQKGKPAPSFQFSDMEGNKVELSALKGKYIYIDAWFTGCHNCVDSYPAWNKLVESAKDRNDIVFLSICFDRNANTWKDWANKYGIKGMRGISYGNDPKGFAVKYKVDFAPVYILIDKEGKILDPRAPGPEKIDLVNL